jgi:hypothetical protein
MGKLSVSNVSNRQMYTAEQLPLSGAYSIIGRSVVIHGADGSAVRLACANVAAVTANTTTTMTTATTTTTTTATTTAAPTTTTAAPSTTTPICYGASTHILLRDGVTRTPIYQLKPGAQIVDVDGKIHTVRNVTKELIADSLVRIKANAFGPSMPSQQLEVTSNHLMTHPTHPGKVLSAADLYEEHARKHFGQQDILQVFPSKTELAKVQVYHIVLDEWVMLPVHNLACETAAVTVEQKAARHLAVATN